jgi:curved DNA-binding protein CbpA
VNHYERLKVSQDAPPEVIRAAYRALAAKLHPDRQQQGVAAGLEATAHGEMAALNAAYEVLIDPKLRQEYDATLLMAPQRARMAEAAADFVGGSEHVSADQSDFAPGGSGSTRVDMDWIVPKPASSSGALWPPSRRVAILGGGGMGFLLLVCIIWFWQVSGQHKMEQALSDQYASSRPGEEPALETGDARAPMAASDRSAIEKEVEREIAQATGKPGNEPRRRPTPDELAKMSDEELLRVLPTLDDRNVDTPMPEPKRQASKRAVATAAGGRTAVVKHPLDGRPLNLRADPQLKEDLSMDVSRLDRDKQPKR